MRDDVVICDVEVLWVINVNASRLFLSYILYGDYPPVRLLVLEDLQAQDLWDEFTEKKYVMLKKTHSPKTQWHIIKSDNKHLARLNTMRLILSSAKYNGRSRKLNFKPDPKIVLPGNKELKVMEKQRKKFGRFLS